MAQTQPAGDAIAAHPRYRRAEGVTLYAMSDGSAVAHHPARGEAHALNEEAAALWSAAPAWNAESLAEWLTDRGHDASLAPSLARDVLARLSAAGLLVPVE